MITVTYQEDDVVACFADPEATLLEVSIANKVPHLRECGGQGRCTTCRVQVLDGIEHLSKRTPREARIAGKRGWDPYTRLACQTHACGDVHVRRQIRSAADITLLQTEALRAEPGQEMDVAILVCDIRRFTPFVAAHLPYDVFHILNRFFEELCEPILLNDGYIYQYVGDQVVGLFGLGGVPAAQSCETAVRAGLGMMHALDALNRRILDEFGVLLDIRLGAHFGPLIVGDLGHSSRREFCVVGDAMNVASRIEGANETLGTTFLISETLHNRLNIPIREGKRTPITLKGKSVEHTLIEALDFAKPDPELLVQDTARRLLGDVDHFGNVFFRRLFEAAPSARALFSDDLAAQGRMIVQMLQLSVYGLSRFHEIVPGLVALGRNHIGYGIEAAHYEVFRDVFLETVREILEHACTIQVEQAWASAIGRILDAMRRGAGSHHSKRLGKTAVFAS